MSNKGILFLLLAAAVTLFISAQSTGPKKVGVKRCKMCHKIQYESWAKTKHAQQKPPVECETCHGNGGDFWKPNIMKNLKAAKAAGLRIPTKAFCTAKCHKTRTDEQLEHVHAHKAK